MHSLTYPYEVKLNDKLYFHDGFTDNVYTGVVTALPKEIGDDVWEVRVFIDTQEGLPVPPGEHVLKWDFATEKRPYLRAV